MLTPAGGVGKYDGQLPKESYVIVGAALSRMAPQMIAVQSIASAPDDPAAESAVKAIIKNGDYAGQPLDITFARNSTTPCTRSGSCRRPRSRRST